MKAFDGRFYGGVEGVIVEYNKGESRPNTISTTEMARLTYTQKPRCPFAIENELRFAILSKESYGEILEININKVIDNCHLIENI